MGSKWAGSCLVQTYYTGVEVTDIDKHSSLLLYRINYGSKKFCAEGERLFMAKAVLEDGVKCHFKYKYKFYILILATRHLFQNISSKKNLKKHIKTKETICKNVSLY
jgi:hypothetical protein